MEKEIKKEIEKEIESGKKREREREMDSKLLLFVKERKNLAEKSGEIWFVRTKVAHFEILTLPALLKIVRRNITLIGNMLCPSINRNSRRLSVLSIRSIKFCVISQHYLTFKRCFD